MYMDKQDLIVNNLQRLICHESKPSDTRLIVLNPCLADL